MKGFIPAGRREPLIREIRLPAALETCYRRISAASRYSAFLNSGTDQDFARFSYVGCDPCLVLRARGTHQTIELRGGTEYREGDPFETLREILESTEVCSGWDHAPFYAGGIGAFGYDLRHHVERLPATTLGGLSLPDLVFTVYRTIVIHDRFENRTWASALDYDSSGARGSEAGAEKCIDRLASWMNRPAAHRGPAKSERTSGALRSNFTREKYMRSVGKCLEYIHAGDVYQVNLSQQFSAPLPAAPIDLFARLCEINPAPFSAYVDCDSFQILSSSPERFLKTTGRMVETRPIKGTRPRGKTEEEDAALARELESSEKDNAELAMIVDLERNDLGRVCEFGSVKVTQDRVLEPYATVNHLVATVEGKLREGRGVADLLRATFPGGSITGCPKIRAMEIIDEMEPVGRNFYTGSIGYIGFNGNMDLNIAIRTMVTSGSRVYYNVGGGIVADSDPAAEYEETLDKGRALAEAITSARALSDENVVGMPRARG